ncbi:ABC transporter permease [Nocardia sp. NPDC050406]|uniref:ABC transporter permease n=1 Tax=Nocardia sp. NPDC050406 TaxID=3364318 RepID=UPI0037B84FA6
MGVLAAERIKLTSTRSPWWCAALTAVFAVGIAALLSLMLNTSPEETTGDNTLAGVGITGLAQGMPGFGYLMIMILAVLAVTSEYRFGTIKTTFLATPNRALVLTAKAGLIGVSAAVLSGVLTFLSWFVLKGMLNSRTAEGLSLSGDLRTFYAVPIFVLLVVFLSVGVGALIRQSAGALSLLLLWPVVLEPMAAFFGNVGRNIQVFLPFQNAGRFLGTVEDGSQPWHWGQWGALAYFAAFVAIVFAAALFVVNKRDA